MIYGLMHPGSGLGNQLHRYVAARTVAHNLGCEFSIIGRDNFKGKSFMDLDMGGKELKYYVEYPAGKITVEDEAQFWGEGTNYYNPEFNFIEDYTVIDGEFQDERYFDLELVEKWLKVEPLEMDQDLCVIGFRGGEFYLYPDLGLHKSYFEEGIEIMKKENPGMKFEVHTDDAELANKFFPDLDITQDIEINWRSMRYAKYAIIANSSFYIFPRLLSKGVTIAPRYWARRNTGEWSMPQNYYKPFKYI